MSASCGGRAGSSCGLGVIFEVVGVVWSCGGLVEVSGAAGAQLPDYWIFREKILHGHAKHSWKALILLFSMRSGKWWEARVNFEQ